MADSEVQVLAEAKKLPMPERVLHKNWKARSAAYEDITETCSQVYDEADKCLVELGKFASLQV
jgi:cytoskeleton-associated protein 5